MPHLRMKDSTRWLPTSEGGTILDKNSGACFEVNRVGGIITAWMMEGKSLEDILIGLQDMFKINSERLEADIQGFAAKLLAKGLVEAQS